MEFRVQRDAVRHLGVSSQPLPARRNLQAFSGLLVGNDIGILLLATPPSTKCFAPRPYGRRPIAECLLAQKKDASWSFRMILRRQSRGHHTSINPRPAVAPVRKNCFCFPQDALGPRAQDAAKHVAGASKNCAHCRKHGPKTGPIFWAQNWARLTNWCKKLGPFSGLKIMPALSRFFAEAASHLSCLG